MVGFVQKLEALVKLYYSGLMRIGFVFADLNTGSSTSLLPSLDSVSRENEKDCLILFPGGRLYSKSLKESLKNSVYKLVNTKNLDGSVVWCSTLTGAVGSEEVLERFRHMTGLPMITIDGKTKLFPKIPDVRFNAYDGSKQIVEHCIKVHGIRKIAYIRGPLNHNSGQERYYAYMDALKEAGIEFDEKLVADPRSWFNGADSMKQLLEERGLIPGQDFEAYICASDLMLKDSTAELERHGYSIPEDVIACGFNDSLDARLLNVPATTVRLPYTAIGRISFASVLNIYKGQYCSDRLLPMVPIIRRSCGCYGAKNLKFVGNIDKLAYTISENFLISLVDARFMLETVVKKPTESNIRAFLDLLSSKGADVFEMSDIIAFLESSEEVSENNRNYIGQVSKDVLPFVLERHASLKSYESQRQRIVSSAFNNELLEANSILEVDEILNKNADRLGFWDFKIVMYQNGMSYMVGLSESFSSDLLVPESVKSAFSSGIWIVAPLCTDTEALGYLLMKPKEIIGANCEEIRSAVSSFLKRSKILDNGQEKVEPKKEIVIEEQPEALNRDRIGSEGRTVLLIGTGFDKDRRWEKDPNIFSCSPEDAMMACHKYEPSIILMVLDNADMGVEKASSILSLLRTNDITAQVPIIITSVANDELLWKISDDIPKTVIINGCLFDCEDVLERLKSMAQGALMLPPQTSSILKKAQAYICNNATLPLSRWQIADAVHVSEDYLARIFKKELGLSPWDYLNRFRVELASRMLLNSGKSINEVSKATGFQDQAYFCRVFKNIKKVSPSKIRQGRSEKYKNR